ncbi:TetR family transcriptional regulator [Mycolicibacterium sp. BiH015]|uniref:TetR/AcrR family transcriptional regulator n=1 Tax=Mycolicibacterium sp. BiH015 TaxID=3018808 RepID=UPI0022E35985|nr:TetR/AcrR family transcriptional regulator [Mycolicibacterium sp. BiH015]MDA2895498.1 TetR family transcriptional regulator [Mycolicibacterium sp. BiH015]
MTGDEESSLRERKKQRTRETVRREAFRLFELHGYAQTTIDQIAEAADVSPRTFFRYFPTKESVLITDEFIEPIIDAFLAAPAELSPVAAYRHAVDTVFTNMAGSAYDYALARQRLMYTLPEAKGGLYDEYIRTIRMLTHAMATRLDRDKDDDEMMVLAGAITGVLMATADDAPMSSEAILKTLEILERGLSLPVP